jgi:xylulokinase
MSDLVVGADIGSQSVKTGIYDACGRCVAETAAPLALHRRSATEVDQDPEEFYVRLLQTISSCVADAGIDPSDVAAVGIAGQMAGVLGIGADGRAVTPYDSWLDTRCSAEVEEIAERLGDDVVTRTGCPPMVAHAPKMLWWRNERPGVYARVAKFVVPSAYVAGRLCALDADSAFVDWTHLHFTGLADAASATWSVELAGELDIDLGRLPRIVSPAELVGTLTPGAARECGLRAGTPVAAGLGDTAAGSLGAGVVHAGQLLDTAGTAAVLGVSTSEFRPDASRTLLAMRGALPGQWISLAYLAGGDILRWLPAVLGAPLEELLQEAGKASPAALLFVPYVGGRILPSAPEARGAWHGLDFSHVRGDLVRSMLESVAYEYASFLERAVELHPDLRPTGVSVIGGGKDDRFWNHIKASVLGLPYAEIAQENVACWGAALAAGSACGLVDDLAAAAERGVSATEYVEPNGHLHARYRRRLEEYRALTALREEVLA